MSQNSNTIPSPAGRMGPDGKPGTTTGPNRKRTKEKH